MAEDFLEEIYKEANLLCELKQMIEYVNLYDNYHAVMKAKELLPSLLQVCQRYIEQDRVKGIELFNQVQDLQKTTDLIVIGDIAEHKILPLYEGCMEQWGRIRTTNEEEDFLFESTVSGFLTLKDIKANTYIHSTVDPMWEARKLAECIFDPRKKEYSLLGCGLGYLAYQLYKVSHDSIIINLFEMDARMVDYAKRYGVLEWMPEDRLNIVTSRDIMMFINSIDKEGVGFHVLKPEVLNNSGIYKSMLEEFCIGYETSQMFRKDVEINYWRNAVSDCRMISEFDASSLNKDFVIVAAGPSLDESLDFLRENKGRKTIIAVGTVFRKLLQNNILPDLVTILDPQPITYRQIEGLEEQKIPLLLSMSVYWKIAAAYQGDKYLIPGRNLEDMDFIAEKYEDLWETGGTVTSLGIEAAIRFGAENIYLVGVDLAYPGGFSHASGTLQRTAKTQEGLIPVKGVGNTIVYTDKVLNSYRHQIEEKIAGTPQICYYNMSRMGAEIEGAKSVE